MQSGSGAEPEEKGHSKTGCLNPTDIPQHLNFPGELYLNETSHSKSVKAISRRTEAYFNHDTEH